MQRHGKFITNLKVDMRYFPVSKPIQNSDGTYIEAEPSSKSYFLYHIALVFLTYNSIFQILVCFVSQFMNVKTWDQIRSIHMLYSRLTALTDSKPLLSNVHQTPSLKGHLKFLYWT